MSASTKEESVYWSVAGFIDSCEGQVGSTDSIAEYVWEDLHGKQTQDEWNAIPERVWDAHYAEVERWVNKILYSCGCCTNELARYARHGI